MEREKKLTEDLNLRVCCANRVKRDSVEAQSRSWVGLLRKREGLLTSLKNLPSLATLVDVTSIKARASGWLNGAEIMKTLYSSFPLHYHVLPSAARTNDALSFPGKNA